MQIVGLMIGLKVSLFWYQNFGRPLYIGKAKRGYTLVHDYLSIIVSFTIPLIIIRINMINKLTISTPDKCMEQT